MRRFVCSTLLIAFVCLGHPSTSAAQDIDPRFRTDIERLLDVTGATGIAAQMATLISDQTIDAMRKGQPDVPERAFGIVKETLSQEFTRAFNAPDGLKGALIAVYAKHYTAEDVRALIEFYSTPIGRRVVASMPAVMQESGAAGEAWAQANMPRVVSVLQQRLRAEGLIP